MLLFLYSSNLYHIWNKQYEINDMTQNLAIGTTLPSVVKSRFASLINERFYTGVIEVVQKV